MMPDADYGFRPGAAPEMREDGQLFAHVATGQFGTCAAIKGGPNPSGGKNLERGLKSKLVRLPPRNNNSVRRPNKYQHSLSAIES